MKAISFIILLLLSSAAIAGDYGTFYPKVTKMGNGIFLASALNDTYPADNIDGKTYGTRKEARKAAKKLAETAQEKADATP